MGSAASKAPKRAFPKAQTLQRAENPTSQTASPALPSVGARPDLQQQSGMHADPLAGPRQALTKQWSRFPTPVVFADQQEQEDQEQDFLRQLKQEGVKHAELGSFLDKLGASVAGKHVSTLGIKVLLHVEHTLSSIVHIGNQNQAYTLPVQLGYSCQSVMTNVSIAKQPVHACCHDMCNCTES